jgi:hypothetical protein
MALAVGRSLIVEWKYELHTFGATKFPMAGDFVCYDKVTGCVSVNCTATVPCRRHITLPVSARLCALFIGRQLRNFCDRDITHSSFDVSDTGSPTENRTQTHGKLKTSCNIYTAGPGYSDIALHDNSTIASDFLWYALFRHC